MKRITGGFQNPNGTPVAFGRAFFTLSQDATVVGGPKISGSNAISFNLDANGQLPSNAFIWYTDELSPFGIAYSISVLASGGGLVYGPEFFIFIGSGPTNISSLFPSIYGGSPLPVFSAALLQNPISPQTITGQSLTLTNSAPLILQGPLTATTGSFSGAVSFSSIQGPGFQKQIFTGSGTFTIPAGITQVLAMVVGGGGGGGGANTTGSGGGGGGAAGAAFKWLTGLTPGSTITVTVGGAGAAGTSGGGTGGNGTNSSISSGTQTISTVTASGGIGGAVSGGGGGGSSSGGDLNLTGNAAQQIIVSSPNTAGTNGGGSIFGGGGAGAAGVGTSGQTFGAGGGGAGNNGGVANAGGAGAAGIIIFEWIS